MGAVESGDRQSLSENDIVTKRIHRRSFLSTFGVGSAIALTAAIAAGCGGRHDGTCRTVRRDADPVDPIQTVCDSD